ncbi:cobalt-precorrin-6A reductase [Streptomyces roseirectus]|uniref:Cobalt-precorrin-6A reductase n=1 Tax=Streptomyces roseirectus TaxID=2768066 RepID=A0A7H0I8B9_9ACTN|nr:cobalt-precorrin-6A reductase [Streptomyces roseirectus]QNP69035.1 cobalt-precorrin-6A reductase [Streptomyces roseirectus]
MHVLILGGTTEARELAAALSGVPVDGARGSGVPVNGVPVSGVRVNGVQVTISLAGRVSRPAAHAGDVRVGGFGGAAGLAAWLREHRVTALVDATHPFAVRITRNAVAAAAETGVPLLVLRRDGWTAGPGDRWHDAGSLAEAAELVPRLGRRVLLTTGRLELAAFAHVTGVHFVARSVEPPEPPLPADCDVLLTRGPFTLDDERRLLRDRRLDLVVTKDSGGAATAAKLVAAREAEVPVIVVRRPPVPSGVPVVGDVGGALDWLRGW